MYFEGLCRAGMSRYILISYSGNKGIKLHVGIFIKSLFKKKKQTKQTNKNKNKKTKVFLKFYNLFPLYAFIMFSSLNNIQ